MSRRLPAILAGAVAAGSLLGAAAGADSRAGLDLARQWCASCHLVAPTARGSDAAPPFETMANDPAYTPARLRSWLMAPHPPMPNFNLTRGEIEDVVEYLESLKKR